METGIVTTASPQSVFLEHESWLRTVVRSRLHEADAVEDVMQNIALAIVRHRSLLSEINRMGAWLYQIAVRQVLMYRRSSGRRRKMQDRLAIETGTRSDHECPLQNLLAAEAQANVHQALAELSDIDRQMLLLKYSEGWSYGQLADHLGVREDTVEYRLLKARKNLRRLMLQFDGENVQSC